MLQRSVLHCLSITEWKVASRLPVQVGEIALTSMAQNGWIQLRGEKHNTEAKLTAAGEKAMRARI
jgi:hypothetical protein